MSLDLGFSYDGTWRRKRVAKPLKNITFRGPKLHLRRVPIEVRPAVDLGGVEVIQPGAIFAPDLSVELARVITSKPLQQYQKVQITITDGTPFHLVGWVRWCRPVSTESKIISSNPLRYRVEILFEERSRIEQHRVQRYLADFRDRYIFSERI